LGDKGLTIIGVTDEKAEVVKPFVKKLQGAGLEFLRDGEAIDIAVADQLRGLTSSCAWLEFGRVDMSSEGQRVAACRLVGSKLMQVVTPPGWKFEGSLSSTFGFVPSEHAAKGMKYLRHENGLDVYLNPITGKEMYVIGQGAVEVYIEGLSDQRTLVVLGNGQVVGEMALIDYGYRSASVRATKDGCKYYVVTRDDFISLCQNNTRIGFIVMRNLAIDLAFKLRHRNLTEM